MPLQLRPDLSDDRIVSGTDSQKPSPTAGVLRLVQDLTSRAIRCQSATDLLGAAFHTLFDCVAFDVAVAVLLEQQLDLYIATRRGAEGAVGEPMITRLRQLLETLVPSALAGADLMVRAEEHDLPAAAGERRDALRHEIHCVLKQDERAAGVVVLWREEPFSDEERQILEIGSTQISIHFSNLRSREKIVALAEIDDLTGVPNRRYFRRHLVQEIDRATAYNLPLSLLIIDVDNFKDINDAFGHATGDFVLSELCATIRNMLRSPDWLTRFGGDELAVMLPHTDLPGACTVAERILAKVRDLTVAADENQTVRCSLSIGVAQLKPTDRNFSDLVRRADDRLYEAKRQGKNRYMS